MTEPAPALPGLELPPHKAGDLERAVHTTLEALRARGYLDEEVDAARNELAVTLARIIEDKERRGRTSTVGNDARVLMELLAATVPEDAGTSSVDEQLRAALDELEREEAQRVAPPADAGTQVRDTT